MYLHDISTIPILFKFISDNISDPLLSQMSQNYQRVLVNLQLHLIFSKMPRANKTYPLTKKKKYPPPPQKKI